MKLTADQQAAVDQRGRSLLVSASAGSGKTAVLAERCLALVSAPHAPCPLDRLLVATFTRAAAAELRVRIGDMLRAAADAETRRDLRERLRRQAALVAVAEIGTIDSWTHRIVREHFDLVGVDPAFVTLPPEEALLLREDALDALFEWIYRAPDALAADARTWIAAHSDTSDDFLRDLLRDLHAYRDHLPDAETWLAEQRAAAELPLAEQQQTATNMLAAAARAECAAQAAQLPELLASVDDPAAAPLHAHVARLDEWAQRLADPGQLRVVAAEIDACKLPAPRNSAAAVKRLFDEVGKRWLEKRLRERHGCSAIDEVLSSVADAAGMLRTLLGLETRYAELVAEAKRERAAYEFGDVQRMALRLLGQRDPDGHWRPTPTAETLRQRYEHILVDEYQDTSPVQALLFQLVTRDQPSNRCMVGDVKQSIYGFRQAEPRLFAQQADAFGAGREDGALIVLRDNFRSHRDVLAALNPLFAALFDRALGGTNFGPAEQLAPGRDAAERPNPTLDGSPRMSVHLLPQRKRGGDDESSDDELEAIEREARIAGAEILKLLDSGVEIPGRGPDAPARPLQRRDIAVLVRVAQKNMGFVVRSLRTMGIPCVSGGREALLDALEVRDICNVLRLIVNRRQDLPLAAHLRGPLVGLSATELQHIRQLAPHGDFLDAVLRYADDGLDRELVAKLRAALDQLARWERAARHEQLPLLLRRILREGELELFAAGQRGGATRTALQAALLRFAGDFSRRGRQGVAEFLDYLERLNERDFELGAQVATGENVVRVMTIHASKGLEFPVVFLLHAGRPLGRSAARRALHCDETRGVGLRFMHYPARRRIVSAAQHIGKFAEQAADVEEELRLLYVALTRARERLFIVGHAAEDAWDQAQSLFSGRPVPLLSRQSASSMLDWVLTATASQRLTEGVTPPVSVALETPPADVPAAPSAATAPIADSAGKAWATTGESRLLAQHAAPLTELPAVMSVSALKQLAAADPDVEPAHTPDLGAGRLSSPRFAEPLAADGRLVGLAVHRLMQHADLAELGAPDAVRRQIARLVAGGQLEADDADLIDIDDVVWLMQTDAGRLLAHHGAAAQREVPLVYALPVGTGDERTIVRGVIDCLLPTPDGLAILDYKTDRPADDADLARRIAGYRVQLQLYAAAAAEIFAAPVCSAQLLLLAARRTVDVPLERPELQALLARPKASLGAGPDARA